ncbi:NADH dehydrogenase I, chain F [gamma proteobacterium HdN1]|nr:NADH dehydrogenase I, chain F [gamma proteobacterium HdN1]
MEKVLTRHIGQGMNPPRLVDYQQSGGYEGFRNALRMKPAEVVDLVKASNLRGRGGAGFPTGMKWSFVPPGEPGQVRYVIANADEMEPGTYKDRWLLEGDPHQFLEGMMIAAHAVQALTGYIFLRCEYTLAARRLQEAIEENTRANLLGKNILGSGFNFSLHLHSSAGRYICGEETALINSLEGRRAVPRAKPPFPQVSGLWGKPTVVNNVETFCNLPHILRHGPEWFIGLGLVKDAGTKIFGASGRVKTPGAWELPMGTPIREIFEKYAGGMQDGYRFRGFLPGGGSTDFLVEQHLDLPMEYDVIGKAGSRMGTGQLIVLDDRTCPVAMVLNLVRFFAQESCGWCTPCRDGLPHAGHILMEIEQGRGQARDLEKLEGFTRFLAPGNTYCALAPGAVEPLQSALKYFREDFERHIQQKGCPYRH